MQACVRLARQVGVRLGAHPGPWNRTNFGRGHWHVTPDELELLILQQVGALGRIAQIQGTRLHHIKLHGALYHATEADAELGVRYVALVAKWWPSAKIYARAGGRVARLAKRFGAPVWEEAFLDRGYREDGSLIRRDKPGALLTRLDQVIQRVRDIVERAEITTSSGTRFRVQPQTLCLHSDTPRASRLARVVRELLKNE
jgi:UPF0271 protein